MAVETTVGRLLTLGTYASIVLLAAGVAAMLLAGRSPLAAASGLDLARLPADLAALRPEGFLWLGLLVALVTPAARVLVALVGFTRRREREMSVIAAAVLVVIVLGVVIAQSPQP
jgi:uncharacterized membrane protein